MAHSIRSKLAQEFSRRNLNLLGIVDLDVRDDFSRFATWLQANRHGSMAYLKAHLPVRQNPAKLFPGARNAIVFGLNYHQVSRREEGIPKVAQYARLPDYHKLMRGRGREVLSWLKSAYSSELEADGSPIGRVLVDTAPLFERALAAKSPRGFIGKNTCFIHPVIGSFLLLGEILTSLPLPIDSPVAVDPTKRDPKTGGCGSCRRCQVHCPTNALSADYQIDARRCISYWTIENRGPIPTEFWPALAEYWYGCDICQTVCPYNRGAADLPLQTVRALPPLSEVATMDQAYYERWFGGTPMTRAKRDGLRRNALIAMTVIKDPALPRVVRSLELDGSDLIQSTLRQITEWQSA